MINQLQPIEIQDKSPKEPLIRIIDLRLDNIKNKEYVKEKQNNRSYSLDGRMMFDLKSVLSLINQSSTTIIDNE